MRSRTARSPSRCIQKLGAARGRARGRRPSTRMTKPRGVTAPKYTIPQRIGVVTCDMIPATRIHAATPPTKQRCFRPVSRWTVRVTLLPAESLLLCRSHDLAVTQQTGGAIVIKHGDPQDVLGTASRHGVEVASSRRVLAKVRYASCAIQAATEGREGDGGAQVPGPFPRARCQHCSASRVGLGC